MSSVQAADSDPVCPILIHDSVGGSSAVCFAAGLWGDFISTYNLSPLERRLGTTRGETTVALITTIGRASKERNSVHREVDCHCSIFEEDGKMYLQLDTFGSPSREIPGRVSQSLQFDSKGAAALLKLLEEVFGSR